MRRVELLPFSPPGLLEEGQVASLGLESERRRPIVYFLLGPDRPLMRRETRSLRPPIFLESSLSGGDNGRDRLFQAQSRLSWLGENATSSTNLAVILQ